MYGCARLITSDPPLGLKTAVSPGYDEIRGASLQELPIGMVWLLLEILSG
jgi:hypothetical protein